MYDRKVGHRALVLVNAGRAQFRLHSVLEQDQALDHSLPAAQASDQHNMVHNMELESLCLDRHIYPGKPTETQMDLIILIWINTTK